MKITDVKVWLVQGIKYNWTLLKIYTDEGYTGVGEATNWPGSPIVYEAAKHIGSRIIGLDPMKTDFIWTKLYRDLNWVGPYGASMCAISGIDMALLDLKERYWACRVMSFWEELTVRIFFCMPITGLRRGGTMKLIMQNRHVR